MRTFVSVCRVLVWLILVLTTTIQVMAVIGIYIWNSADVFNPVLLIVAAVLMLLAVVLFFALPRGKVFPLVLAAMAGIFFVILALQLKETFPVTVTERGLAGISLWTAMYRHMSPALIPLLMFPIFWDNYTDRRAAKLAEADQLTPTYFEDEQPTDAVEHKPKRSVRTRMSKQSEENA